MVDSLYDKQAVKILFATYWSSKGWKKDQTILPEDFAYAKNKGVMFDSRTISHDEIVKSAKSVAEEIGHLVVADAFIASLSKHELAYRSALGSFATSFRLPIHKYETGRFRSICRICGDYPEHQNEDLSVLNFERLKWGGVRHLQPCYAWLDLAEFRKLPIAQPTTADREIFKRLLDVIASQPSEARPNNLEKAIAGLFPSSKDERRTLLQILGYCGVLQPKAHPTFFNSYANMDDRAQPDEGKNDWAFPVLWWRGSDGVNTEAVKFYFPNL